MNYNEVLTVFEVCKALCLLFIFAVALFAAWRSEKAMDQRDYYKDKFHQAAKMRMDDLERDKYER